MKKGTLYLIPNTLGGPAGDVTTSVTKTVVQTIKTFIVEELRSARRLLRAIGYTEDFENVNFILLNEHTKTDNEFGMVEALIRGENMGVISEAGVPCVADPGNVAVMKAHQIGAPVVPLVGASSILLTLMASGLNGQNFAFNGYLPRERSERIKKLQQLEQLVVRNNQTQLMMDAPYRNEALFEDIVNHLSPRLLLCIAADLTMDSEQIGTKSLEEWMAKPPKLHKRPVMFAIGRG